MLGRVGDGEVDARLLAPLHLLDVQVEPAGLVPFLIEVQHLGQALGPGHADVVLVVEPDDAQEAVQVGHGEVRVALAQRLGHFGPYRGRNLGSASIQDLLVAFPVELEALDFEGAVASRERVLRVADHRVRDLALGDAAQRVVQGARYVGERLDQAFLPVGEHETAILGEASHLALEKRHRLRFVLHGDEEVRGELLHEPGTVLDDLGAQSFKLCGCCFHCS